MNDHPDWVLPLAALRPEDVQQAGGKAVKLAALLDAGAAVPEGLCLLAPAYERFVAESGLGEQIQVLLGRKRFEDMRWEEIWDLALRIRNLFVRTPLPDALQGALSDQLRDFVAERPVVVRSSAPAEDAAASSFAGLHESVVDVRGIEAVLAAVKRVWASLWSDRALLYRSELGLDPRASRIAVVIQALVAGRASGVLFTQSPMRPDQAVVEAVWGLNQGLVDGVVAPDRWFADRVSGAVKGHAAAEREQKLAATPAGPRLVALSAEERGRPPLDDAELDALLAGGRDIEQRFGAAQDIEWTLAADRLHLLQARPITVAAGGRDDERRWYLTLHRSLENLRGLQRRIEDEVLPGMAADAAAMAEVDLAAASSEALAAAIRRRRDRLAHWNATYRRECIPFAHAIRLFGQVYNDELAPADPFAFVELLQQGDLLARQRNAELQRLAALAAGRQQAAGESGLDAALDDFLRRFGPPSSEGLEEQKARLLVLARRLAEDRAATEGAAAADPEQRRRAFLDRFSGTRREQMTELLELARVGYRLRDDDNIFLGRIEAQLGAALHEARTRRDARGRPPPALEALLAETRLSGLAAGAPQARREPSPEHALSARQLVGQPAAPGIALGPARVVVDEDGLFAFRAGEVLVCDAIEPNMTLVAPLAAAVVERRGGMLIHGAIIAREYGLPCVTGVPGATEWIRTGDQLSVDGHVGLVTIDRAAPATDT